jgi:hypothetical protein
MMFLRQLKSKLSELEISSVEDSEAVRVGGGCG